MAGPQKYTHHQHYEEDEEEATCEERSLCLLNRSNLDLELSPEKDRRKATAGTKKHQIKRMMRRPAVLPETVLELLVDDQRETAMRYLSNFLIDKREVDPDNYYLAGFLLYNSCATMAILLQEVVEFYRKMVVGDPNVRCIKRLSNVLTLFQCIAANMETRQKFVDARAPNYLIPLITFGCSVDVYDNVRAIALSVIGILCQHREPKVIQWAIESDILSICHTILCTGNELNRVIAMHITEAIIPDIVSKSSECNPAYDRLLREMLNTWKELVNLMATHQDYSPRLLFHIIRCYCLLCCHSRGYNLVMTNFPIVLTTNVFDKMQQEFPLIKDLLQKLLLYLGKVVFCTQLI